MTNFLLFLILLALIGGGALVGNVLLILIGMIGIIFTSIFVSHNLREFGRQARIRREDAALEGEVKEAFRAVNRMLRDRNLSPVWMSWGEEEHSRGPRKLYWLRDHDMNIRWSNLTAPEFANQAERIITTQGQKIVERASHNPRALTQEAECPGSSFEGPWS